MQSDTLRTETDRIRREYSRRATEIPPDHYSILRPENLFAIEGRNRAFIQVLKATGSRISQSNKVLEVGCGDRGWSPLFSQIGIPASNLAGIDLMVDRIRTAKSIVRGGGFCVGNAAQLPWKSGTFDVVLQSQVFTSILQEDMRCAVAEEMVRVLRDEGFIIWYDFIHNNPWNSNVRGVPKSMIRKYFPESGLYCRRVTLALPITRRIIPFSWPLAEFLQHLWILNSHLMAIIVPLRTRRRNKTHS